MSPAPNAAQEAALARLNDSYCVARWDMRGSIMLVTCDDGDRAEVDRDGSITWESVA